ncbi:DNA damage-induced apoptosis suppressor protein [Diceros bicornis minor]|uniref:DNA damage-induced apoptosis suppressor protein n=1 Tax=Diceros bicornis minor TaxID=77932 RepID=UPI0026F37190|nr:DNA damage-induced apoptosis suppressor protein [Diceros bicornis minor]XP_058401489.1 DNA damage-induced apoptosis suppressor protein [Diceros bicornis minor]XP_058401490.1 DNA damage-induced apoptosis suppressor protein [Diceros bicornis minor]XP_058401491.1 DNA damage-induced apoptosis suppressor protein [Diceros bicornis minor]XP_058401493.1 DNA damage-induced apoptosis suppressor protein [Diceros bicornis minor]XP_058401494.1 DNA damage-induced apoptosis suppressor protein [Diceros bic
MNRRRKFLLASVLALQNSSFIYPSCEKCFSRVLLVSKRSNCPKCGSTGEAENASYRYKLSLKVAESNKLFGITVFGSCLDAFFGLTATGLHRYIQDPNEIPQTLDSNTTQNLLTKAVETCFVGQSFIFGVTNFENQHGQGSDSYNFLRQCPDRRTEVKALVACQMVLPDPGVAGFTVIDYFHQLLQLSDFRNLHSGYQTPNSHLLALEHSSSDLSNICGPDSSSCFFESHGRDSFSRFWQPSLELTSIVSQLTEDDDFSASEQSKAIDTLHQNRKYISFAEATASNSCPDAIQGSWSLVSYMDKNSTAQKLGEELGLQANQRSAVHSSHHEIEVTDSNLFSLKMREPLEPSNTKSFHSAVEIKNRYSQRRLICHRRQDVDTHPSLQERSTCCPPSSLRLEEIAGASQDCDPEIWDDLPFSESLNKFLAVIENEIAVIQTDASSRKHHLDNDIDKLHADHSRLYLTPQRTTGALHTPPVALRLSQTTVKANSGKDNFLSNCETNSSTSVQEESQPDNTAEAVSISSSGRDISEYFLPNACLSALFPSSKGLRTTVSLKKSARISPHRAEISLKLSTSESDHSCLNIKYFNGCGEKSLSEMSEKLTTLCSRRYNDVSDLCNLGNKQYSRWPKNQGDSFTICRKLTYPLEALCSSPSRSTNTLKEISYGHMNNNFTQNYSPGLEGSYNASADLFDDSAKEMDLATEITKKSQGILLQRGKSLAESHHTESDLSLRSHSENSSQSSQKFSLQNMSVSLYPRTCSSPRFQSDSECDFEDSQDFVPCSQSTPVAGFHQTRIQGMEGAFKKLPAFYSDLDANYKKTRISSENDAQQATPSCPKNIKTPSQKSRSPIISDITQPEVFNSCPIAECLETDVDEWVPPTTKKVFLSDMLGFQAIGLRKCRAACNSPDERELLRKKLKYVKRKTDKCLIKKGLNLKNMLTTVVTKQKTHNYNSPSSGWISKESVLGLGSCSEIKCCLPFSENCPSSAPETKSAWSPELFS